MMRQFVAGVRNPPLLVGFILMFALTWPIELGLASQSHGLLPFHIPPVLGLFVGYGFAAASLMMTGITSGPTGIRALLRRLLVWRVGVRWYVVALFGAAIDILAIGIHVLLGGAMPDFARPLLRQFVGPSFNLWFAAPPFLLYQILYGALVASLIVGVIWGVWHLPKFLTAGDAHAYSFWLFALDTLFHAALNTADVCLPILPMATGETPPLLIVMGLRCVVAVLVVALSRLTPTLGVAKTIGAARPLMAK